VVGSVLPPCPFVAYPVIKGFSGKRVGLSTLIAMLVATTMVEVGQLFAGLAVFGVYVVGVRICFAFIGAVVAGTVFHYMLHLTGNKNSES